MAAPTDDFLNQAVDETLTVLSASPYFMSPDASSAPLGAAGVVMLVEKNLPEVTAIPDYRLPHCGIAYLADDPVMEDSAASETDYVIQVGLRLYHRGTDQQAVCETLQAAAASVAKIVALQMAGGGQWNGFAGRITYLGGKPIDVKEATGFGVLQAVKIALQITRPDYE